MINQQTEWVDGFFKIKKLNMNVIQLREITLQVNNYVKERFKDVVIYKRFGNRSTNLFAMYNTFLIATGPLYDLFKEINIFWNQVKPDNDNYYIGSWVNVYEESESIGWHHHWGDNPGTCAWHGFFCVDVDVSRTSYALDPLYYHDSKAVDYIYNGEPILKYNDEYQLVDVVGRDNFLILSPSKGDFHRNIPWSIKDRPRITIAFDIVPGRLIDNSQWENHWIPFI